MEKSQVVKRPFMGDILRDYGRVTRKEGE